MTSQGANGLTAPTAWTVQHKGQERREGDEPTVKRVGRDLQRAAWQWAQDNRRADGSLPSGRTIGCAFERRPRWGRLVRTSGSAGELEPG